MPRPTIGSIKPNDDYTISKQEFLNSVINKIGRQEYADQVYINPLKRLKGGFIESATDIEEIYVSRAKDTGYDKDGTGVLDKVKPSTKVQYHSYEVEHGYKTTVHKEQLRKGFLSKGGVSTMAEHIIQSLHTGSEIDEYQDIIDTMKAFITNSKVVSNRIKVKPIIDETSAKDFCKEVKKVIPKMGEWSSTYSSVENFTKPERLILFLDSDVNVEINTEYLASLFNMTVSELNDTTKILIPNFKEKIGDSKTIGLLCDERCLKIHPTYYDIDSIKNTRGKFVNYDLVTISLLSYTDWYPFVVFTDDKE